MVTKGCIERKIRAILESTKESGYEQVITPHIKRNMCCHLYYAK
jgi:hypothetical protein